MKWRRQRRKYRLLLVYKTGFRTVVRCDGYTFTHNRFNGELSEVNLENPRPRPVYLNIQALESAHRL